MVFRRTIAIALVLALAPLLTLALLALQVSGALLSPDFYKEQLRSADVYNFFYDDLLLPAVEEQLAGGDELPPAFNLDATAIVTSFRDALPPEWLQEQVEEVIDSLGPYLLGRSDSFTLTISPVERAAAVEAAIVALAERVDLRRWLLEEQAPETVQEQLNDRELPLSIRLTSEEALDSLGRVATPSFVRSQQTGISTALAAYLTGRSDSFSFTFDFSERAPALEEELIAILGRADLSGYLRREALEPALRENIAADVALPFDILVSQEEIRQAINAAVSPEWLDAETLKLAEVVAPYVAGRNDAFRLTVDLVEPTDAAVRTLAATLKGRYTVLQASGVDVEGLLGVAIHRMAPDDFTFTQQDLIEATQAAGGEDPIAEVRDAMRNGWTVTDDDFRKALEEEGSGLPDAMDAVREGFSEGWTWTEEDLRETIADPDSADSQETLDSFDMARSWVNRMRLIGPLLLALALALVAGAGFLGGRSRAGKLGWAGGALLAAALGVLLLTFAGAMSGALSDAQAEAAMEAAQAQGDERVEARLEAKLLEVADRVADDVVGGMRLWALASALVGVAAIGGAFALSLRRQSAEGPPAG